MNQVLRFLASLSLASAMTVLTTSCSSFKSTELELALNPGEVRYRLHIFTTDEELDVTNSFPNATRISGIYSKGEGQQLVKRYQKNKRYHSDTSESIIAKRGKRVSFSKPANPHSPTSTNKLGTTVSFFETKLPDEQFSFSMKLKRISYLGKLKGRRIFSTLMLESQSILRSGQFILAEGNNRPLSEKADDKSDGPATPANFVALIQVEVAPK